MEYLVYYMNN